MVIQGPPGRQQLPRFERLRIGMLLLKNATLLEQQLQLRVAHIGIVERVCGLGADQMQQRLQLHEHGGGQTPMVGRIFHPLVQGQGLKGRFLCSQKPPRLQLRQGLDHATQERAFTGLPAPTLGLRRDIKK